MIIGNNIFASPEQKGDYFNPVEKAGIRWTSGAAAIALITLAGNGGTTFLLNTIIQRTFVNILNVVATCSFYDSSSNSNVNLSRLVRWSPTAGVYNGGEGNSVYSFFDTNLNPLNIQLPLNSSRQLEITTSLDGGDVLAGAGITPGAGDLCNWTLNVCYF